jgi:small conductance mechanosensitive channel
MSRLYTLLTEAQGAGRVLAIAAVAVGAVLLLHLVRAGAQRLTASKTSASVAKVRTVASLLESILVFGICFTAVGLILKELGISLTAYLASASILGLAVGFGSQGLVQDVVTGLTLVLSNAFDVGEMVELSGQTGIVQKVGIRFTVLLNFLGAEVLIPNRSISSVITYPKGYIRAFVDVQLPSDGTSASQAEARVDTIVRSLYEQFPAILLREPSIEGRMKTASGSEFLRVRFRLWPGQTALIENVVRNRLVQGLRGLDPGYADWMVAVTYRAESRVARTPVRPRP